MKEVRTLNHSERNINIYHFINYTRNDLDVYIETIKDMSGTVCLDLEDSVQDLYSSANTPELKQKHRGIIKEIFTRETFQNFKWGIRINSFNTQDYKKDIEFLCSVKNKRKIKSLLLPKVESRKEVTETLLLLKNESAEIEEIIPVIETVKGFNNLKLIISNPDEKLKRIAFGHCDFNFDNNIFPFFHQNSREYWQWVIELVSVCETSGIEFINSPFLRLNESEAFQSVLTNLLSVCSLDFGQIVLSYRQAKICREFEFKKRSINGFERPVPKKQILEFANNLIAEFENNNEKKGFSVSRGQRLLISPHEYLSARKYLNSK